MKKMHHCIHMMSHWIVELKSEIYRILGLADFRAISKVGIVKYKREGWKAKS